jgi:hypothetical protein
MRMTASFSQAAEWPVLQSDLDDLVFLKLREYLLHEGRRDALHLRTVATARRPLEQFSDPREVVSI